MHCPRTAKGVFIILASIGLPLCGSTSPSVARAEKSHQAEPQSSKDRKPREKLTKRRPIIDVHLAENGVLHGDVVDAQGAGVEGASVSIRRNNRTIAETLTDSRGRFQVKHLTGGLYYVKAGRGEAIYRIWTAKAAPPAARDRAMIVSGQRPIRGQNVLSSSGTVADWAAIGLGTTGTVLGAVALEKVNSKSYEYYGKTYVVSGL